MNRAERTRDVARILWVTLTLNWIVALLKLALGGATHCMVIVADGLHSFSDGTSNIVGLIGVSIASHPADHDHPYGHQKYETLASTAIAFLLFMVSFGIIRDAIIRLLYPLAPEVNAFSFLVMAFTLAVNFFTVGYERRAARRLGSDLLLSDSWHTLTDVFVTLSVLAALVGIWLRIPHLDSLFTLSIAVVIIVTAVGILKRSSDILCDKAALEPRRIERIVRGVSGVKDCHEIRTRGRKDAAYVDLHILVDNDMTVLASHRLATIIERRIRDEIPGVQDVVVHVEPVSHEHDELERYKYGNK